MLNIPTTEERLGKSPQRLVNYFVLAMALLYMGLGIWLWVSSQSPSDGGFVNLGTTARRVLGSVFILYGLVRFIRAYRVNFRKKTPNDNE